MRILAILLVLCVLASVQAADNYKPYLHKPVVPDHPEVRLFGQYSTNLFPGAATYSYPIEVPKGTNGLQPSIAIAYNSQSMNQRPGILGAGWQLASYDYIYRDVNSTIGDTADDEFFLILGGAQYKLVQGPDDKWYSEVDNHFRIEKDSNWNLTTKDGTNYYFGYSAYGKWFITEITDTFGNKVFFDYSTNPYDEDTGSVYLSKIEYNSGKERVIKFRYEDSVRPDRRLIYFQGNGMEESRRLENIEVYTDEELVRRYNLNYTANEAHSTLKSIKQYGNDNTSLLHTISFDYFISKTGYTKLTDYVPPVLFCKDDYLDQGVRLVDVNNDGFMDIIQGNQSNSVNKIWINDKSDSWELSSMKLPGYLIDSSGLDEGYRFADVNKDGYTDIVRADNGVRKVYINNGTVWNEESWSFPGINFVDASGQDQGLRFAEVDGDGRVDLILAKSTKQVYLNTGNGWTLSSWSVPYDFVHSNYSDTGVRLSDVNGDGLVDFLRGAQGTRWAYINNGTAWIEDSTWNPPLDFYGSAHRDIGVRIVDVNGDGLADIIQNDRNVTKTKGAWINNGSGWVSNSSWEPPEYLTLHGHSTARRLADINGDGLADIVFSDRNEDIQFTMIKNKTYSLLKSITNEYGGITYINYTHSTEFDNTEDGLSKIGFNIWVVANITANNMMNGSFSIFSPGNYSYSLGKYNYNDSEFRGFGQATEHLPSKTVNHYFYQDNHRRGKEYKTEVYDGEIIYSKNKKDYNYTDKNGIYNVTLLFSADYLYDGNENPIITNKSYNYDWYGNLWSMTDHGDTAVAGDERYYSYSYAMNPTFWIMDKVASAAVFENDIKIKQTRYFYDDQGFTGVSKGAVTKIERWNDGGNHSYTYYNYDDHGNVVKETDSLGHSSSIEYEVTKTYPMKSVNALGHTSKSSYDPGTGNMIWQEKNDIRTSYVYDEFGRILKEILPYDTANSPTKRYYYTFDGSPPEKVAVSLKSSANNTQDDTYHYIMYYYDGFGNIVQIKKDLEGKQIVKNLFYDSSFRVASEQNPYFDSRIDGLSNVSNDVNTTYTYDALDRVVYVLNPDGTNKTVIFDQYNITDYDENGNMHMYTLDSHGRITGVHEYPDDLGYNEFLTTYTYDGNDNLVEIEDTLGNEFVFEYDSLGRKTGMDDPDLGIWVYDYDTNGNLVRQTDAKGNEIELLYDALGRIKSKKSHDVNLTFSYDSEYLGTLTNLSMNDINFSYEYDDRMRVIREVKNILDQDFETTFIYDSQNRLVSKNGLSRLDFLYNKLDKVREIPGYIDTTSYSAFGSIVNRSYSNDLVQSFAYDTETNRLQSIYIPSTQNLTYSYDHVGNILSISDSVLNRDHVMTYDALNRMKTATIGSDVYKYTYNPIGNMMNIVENGQSKKFVYNGEQAHAPSQIVDGSASIDVYNPHELNSGYKDRVIEAYLVNDKDTDSTANVSIMFGDGNYITDSVTVNESVMMLIQHNYSTGGDYSVNVTANDDSEAFGIKFGVRAKSLTNLYNDYTNSIFEFVMMNDLKEIVYNVAWNCTDGIVSIYSANLSGEQSLYDYFAHNYSTPGVKTIRCDVTSDDGNDWKKLTFLTKDLEIEDYDVLISDISRRIVAYDVVNYFHDMEANISMTAEGATNVMSSNISNDEAIMVFVETNYSSDGAKSFEIELSAENYSESFVENFMLESVSIDNFVRDSKNYTTQVYVFDVTNQWHDGSVNWSIDSIGIENVSLLNNSGMIMVMVEHNYTTYGETPVEVRAVRDTVVASVDDQFELNPVEIESMDILNEGILSVTELVVDNNIGGLQTFNWQYDTDEENLSSDGIEINDTCFVFIEANYSSSGVYVTSATINSTLNNDTQSGVIVI